MTMRTALSKTVMYGMIGHCGWGFTAQMRRRVRKLFRDQWRPIEQVRATQLEQLNILLEHCVKHVPYYRQLHARGLLSDHVDCLEDLSTAPTLTKQMLVEEPQAFLADNMPPNYLLQRRSGGSTGNPLTFYITPEAAGWCAAGEIYANMLAGYRWGDPVASLWGSRFDSPPPPTLRQRTASYLSNRIQCTVDRMDDESCGRFVSQLSQMRPTVLVGYTSSLMEMCHYLEQNRITPNFPRRSLVSTAEPLTPSQRQTMERVFGRPVFNRYGSREGGLIAAECDFHQGLHLHCQGLYVEMSRCDGEDGARRLIITKLGEMGMPFIRYELGDYVLGEIGTCACGRGSPTIQAVRGRTVSNLRLPNGAFIAAEAFIVLLDRQAVREYRVVQAADYSVVVELVPKGDWDELSQHRVIDTLTGITQGRVPLRIELRQWIPRTESGKLLPVVSHVPSTIDTAPLARAAIQAA